MEHAASPATCLNCGRPVPDPYCAGCGQATDTHRFSTAHLLHELPHSIWHVDKGLLHTLSEMLRRPGAAIRGYLAGQRRPHFAPLSYVLLLTGISAFLLSVLHVVPFDAHDPAVSEKVRQVQLHVYTPIIKYKSWLEVLTLPVTALLTRLVLRRGGFNYAEGIVINAFVIGTTTAVGLLFLPLQYYWSGTAATTFVARLATATTVLVQARMYGQLLDQTPLSALGRYGRGVLLSLGNFALTILLILAVLLAFNWPAVLAAIRQH